MIKVEIISDDGVDEGEQVRSINEIEQVGQWAIDDGDLLIGAADFSEELVVIKVTVV
jgi:hypothetical protein